MKRLATAVLRGFGPALLLVFSLTACRTSSPQVGAAATTNAPPQRPVRIALFSDTHINRGTNQALHAGRFSRVVDSVNAAGVDLVLVAGDLTEDGAPSEYVAFRREIRRLQVPVWYVPGNHDVGNKALPKGKNPVESVRVANYHMRLGPSWFVREHAGVRVVAVNAPLFSSRTRAEREQWDFLESVLAKPSPLPTIFLTHFPPFVNKPEEPGGEYWNLEPVARGRLFSLLKLGGVDAVLSGHLHRTITNRHDGILYYTTPAVAFSLTKGQPPGWTLVTVPPKGTPTLEYKTVRP